MERRWRCRAPGWRTETRGKNWVMMEAEAGGVAGTAGGQEGSGAPAGTLMSDFRPPKRLEHNVCSLSPSVLLLRDGCLRMITPVPGDLSFYLHQLTQSGCPLAGCLSSAGSGGAGGDENLETPPSPPIPTKGRRGSVVSRVNSVEILREAYHACGGRLNTKKTLRTAGPRVAKGVPTHPTPPRWSRGTWATLASPLWGPGLSSHLHSNPSTCHGC